MTFSSKFDVEKVNAFKEMSTQKQGTQTLSSYSSGCCCLNLERLPFKFDTLEQEVNIVLLFHLLRFDCDLDDINAIKSSVDSFHGLDDVILFGLMGLHLSYHNISSKLLSEVSISEVSSTFNIPISKEVQVSAAIHMTKPSEARQLVHRWTERLNYLGTLMLSRGYATTAKFFLHSIVKDCEDGESLVKKLAESLDFVQKSIQEDILSGVSLKMLVIDCVSNFIGKDEKLFSNLSLSNQPAIAITWKREEIEPILVKKVTSLMFQTDGKIENHDDIIKTKADLNNLLRELNDSFQVEPASILLSAISNSQVSNSH